MNHTRTWDPERILFAWLLIKILCIACIVLLTLCWVVYNSNMRRWVIAGKDHTALAMFTAWVFMLTLLLAFVVTFISKYR